MLHHTTGVCIRSILFIVFFFLAAPTGLADAPQIPSHGAIMAGDQARTTFLLFDAQRDWKDDKSVIWS